VNVWSRSYRQKPVIPAIVRHHDSIHSSVFNRSTLVYIVLDIEIYLIRYRPLHFSGHVYSNYGDPPALRMDKEPRSAALRNPLRISCMSRAFKEDLICCAIQKYRMTCAQIMSQTPISQPNPFLISQGVRQASKNRLLWLSHLVTLAKHEGIRVPVVPQTTGLSKSGTGSDDPRLRQSEH